MSVRVVTDSTSYIPQAMVEQLDITVVSLSVNFDDGTTIREVDIDSAGFYERLSGGKAIPTSSQPAVAEVAEAFRELVNAGHQVVGVFISSEMSGTFESASLARELVLKEAPDAIIELVDSRSNSMQLGMCVLEAARVAQEGGDATAAVEAATRAISRTRFLFTPHDLEYLRRGGRIGGASALLGALLQVRPILTVEDGSVGVFAKVRTKKRAMQAIVSAFAEEIQRAGLVEAVVHHIDDEPEGEQLAALVREVTGKDVTIVGIGPVIGLHVGPGTVGLVYRTEKEVEKLHGEAKK